MRRPPCWIALGIVALAVSAPSRAADVPHAFEWKDGDRVVLVGDTLIERDQKYGYLETLITAQNPAKSITFRNLGWSGDTVRGLSRARFGPPAEGYQHLKDHVIALKPTVLIVGYGMAESFDGEAGLPAFVSGLHELLDAVVPKGARVVLLSPNRHEDLGRPLPDPAIHNKALMLYRDAVARVAKDRGHAFVDLFAMGVGDGMKSVDKHPHTNDGITLNAFGYWQLSAAIELALKFAGASDWDVRLDRSPTDLTFRVGASTTGVEVSKVEVIKGGGVRFDLKDARLPSPTAPSGTTGRLVPQDRRLEINGLDPGTYALTSDGVSNARASADEWSKGVWLDRGPERDQVDALRQTINAKNELYFYRWRPQNETYLFGFRKHEQGNNASEIPLFDPLVEAKEKEIAKLRVPVTHVYELTREAEKGR